MTRMDATHGAPPLRIEAWRGWIEQPLAGAHDPRLSVTATPAAPALAPLLRRRLDPTGRAACQALAELELPLDAPLVFASRHGPSGLTLEILRTLAQRLPVSPAQFSMAVHNAVLGVYSIARGHQGPIQAIAAAGGELDALFNEALGYLSEGHAVVGALFCDARLAPLYRELNPGPEAACAVAMRLTLKRGAALAADPGAARSEASALELLRFLLGESDLALSPWQWLAPA